VLRVAGGQWTLYRNKGEWTAATAGGCSNTPKYITVRQSWNMNEKEGKEKRGKEKEKE